MKNSVHPIERKFSNGNTAQVVTVPSDFDPAEALKLLGIDTPKTLILLSGGGEDLDENLKARLFQQFSRGVARAAWTLAR